MLAATGVHPLAVLGTCPQDRSRRDAAFPFPETLGRRAIEGLVSPGLLPFDMRRIEHEIKREARRLILAQERRHRLHAEEQVRLRRRSVDAYILPPSVPPSWWCIESGFDPYKVN